MQSTRKSWVIASAFGAATSLALVGGALAQTRTETQTTQQQQRAGQAEQRTGQTGTMSLPEHQREVSNSFKQVSDHAKFLQDEAKKPEAFSKSVARTHAEEIGNALDESQSHYMAWRDAYKDQPKMQPRLEKMDRLRDDLKQQHAALEKELDKEMPDPKLISSYAKRVEDAAKGLLEELKKS